MWGNAFAIDRFDSFGSVFVQYADNLADAEDKARRAAKGKPIYLNGELVE